MQYSLLSETLLFNAVNNLSIHVHYITFYRIPQCVTTHLLGSPFFGFVVKFFKIVAFVVISNRNPIHIFPLMKYSAPSCRCAGVEV